MNLHYIWASKGGGVAHQCSISLLWFAMANVDRKGIDVLTILDEKIEIQWS